jgi:hypothetical protein
MKPKVKQIISRRAFVKLSAQFLAFIAYARSIQVALSGHNPPGESLLHSAGASSIPLVSAPRPYGRGSYGQGVYPGYRTYIPLVNKEQE